MRRRYVAALRGIRSGLRRIGVLTLLDRWAVNHRAGLWVRSLFAIYDLDDLRKLDVPWWTFSAADRVGELLAQRPVARVFEWGSGASTFWLARRAAEVHAVEHDEAWAQSMRAELPANAELTVVLPTRPEVVEVGSRKRGFAGLDFADYVRAIDRVDGEFDLIVIDGRAREACLPRALARLASGGVVVFDNVERKRYRAAIAQVADQVSVDERWGLTPSLPYPTRTALLRIARSDG